MNPHTSYRLLESWATDDLREMCKDCDDEISAALRKIDRILADLTRSRKRTAFMRVVWQIQNRGAGEEGG